MALSDCYGFIRKTAGAPDAKDDELRAILEDMEARKAARFGDSPGYEKPAAEMEQEAKAAAAVARRNAMLNLAKRIDMRASIASRLIESEKEGVKQIGLTLESELTGVNTDLTGGKNSVAREQMDRHEITLSGLTNELQDKGLFKVARSRALERQWVQELGELSKGEDGKPGASGSAEALEIAKTIQRWQDVAKAGLNKAGAWIGDYFGYVTRQTHDANKLWAAGFEQWLKDTYPLLDKGKTLTGVDDPRDFMQRVYNALVTGTHMTPDGLQDMKDPAFTGTGNLAKKLSQSRVLHFQDALSWLSYNDKYGAAPPLDTMLTSLRRAANDTALMNRFGTNPRAEFQSLMRWIDEKYRDTDTQAARNFTSLTKQRLLNAFDFLDGTADRPAHNLLARIAFYVRSAVMWSKLGNVVFTHLSTVATKAAELERHGVPLWEGYGDFVKSLTQGLSPEARASVLREMHATVLGQEGALIERLMPYDSMPGTVAKINSHYMTATGLRYAMGVEKQGTFWKLGARYGALVDKPFDELEGKNQAQLRAFDIGPAEWDILRQAPDHIEAAGMRFLTEQAAYRASEDAIRAHLESGLAPTDRLAVRTDFDHEGMSEAQITAAKAAEESAIPQKIADYCDRLALQLHGLYSEAADRSIVTPGIPERNLWYGGTARGTIKGEFWRAVSLFKMWPTAVIRQQLGADVFGNYASTYGRMGKVGNITALAVAAGLAGILRQTIVDEMTGKEHRPFNDVRTYMAGLAQGGGFGIMGDFMFGNFDRFGRTPLETFAGPIYGAAKDFIIQPYLDMKALAVAEANGDAHGAAQARKAIEVDSLKAVTDYAPYANLFYTKLALDMAFIWRAQEAINPGYLARMEARMKQNTGQRFWISPSKWVHQGVIAPSP